MSTSHKYRVGFTLPLPPGAKPRNQSPLRLVTCFPVPKESSQEEENLNSDLCRSLQIKNGRVLAVVKEKTPNTERNNLS
jgi:hypothetical protein